MQEEIEHKTVNFAISTAKLSARTLLRGAQFFLRQYDKSASQGKHLLFDRTYGLKIRSTSTKTVSHGELEQYVWAADAARSF